MHRIFTAVFGTALLLSITAPLQLRADDQRIYHDRQHNDDHHWDAHEDQAYRMWVKERHRKYEDFAHLKEQDQQAYWAWRHNHSDAVLNINIR